MDKRYVKFKACGQWQWCCCIDDPIYDGIQMIKVVDSNGAEKFFELSAEPSIHHSYTEANLIDLKFHFPASLIDSFYYDKD